MQPITGTHELAETQAEPESYVEIYIGKDATGYGHATRISLRWQFGAFSPDDAEDYLDELNAMADKLARKEINRRQERDDWKVEVTA